MEYYTQEKARGIIDNAKFVVKGVRAYLKEQRHERLDIKKLDALREK